MNDYGGGNQVRGHFPIYKPPPQKKKEPEFQNCLNFLGGRIKITIFSNVNINKSVITNCILLPTVRLNNFDEFHVQIQLTI